MNIVFVVVVFAFFDFHLLKNIILFYFLLLVLKGIYHYWTYFYSFQGLNQMEVESPPVLPGNKTNTASA